jgi:hypothetical protein
VGGWGGGGGGWFEFRLFWNLV